MRGITGFKEKKEINIGNIDIVKMSREEIIKEIKNRLEFIITKTDISKRKLSHILNQPDCYIAHFISYNKFNMSVILDIFKIFQLPPYILFISQSEQFLLALNDNKISELKHNVQNAFQKIEKRQLKKEINNLTGKLNKRSKNYESEQTVKHNKIATLNKIKRKLIKLKKLTETEKLKAQIDDNLQKIESQLGKLI